MDMVLHITNSEKLYSKPNAGLQRIRSGTECASSQTMTGRRLIIQLISRVVMKVELKMSEIFCITLWTNWWLIISF